jgi:hypothetical protein
VNLDLDARSLLDRLEDQCAGVLADVDHDSSARRGWSDGFDMHVRIP